MSTQFCIDNTKEINQTDSICHQSMHRPIVLSTIIKSSTLQYLHICLKWFNHSALFLTVHYQVNEFSTLYSHIHSHHSLTTSSLTIHPVKHATFAYSYIRSFCNFILSLVNSYVFLAWIFNHQTNGHLPNQKFEMQSSTH